MNLVTTHPFAVEELMAFCDGEFSAEETQAVEAHLIECSECADQVRQFRETSQSLREWHAPPVSKRIEEAVEEHLQGADSGRSGRGSKARFGRTSKRRWRPLVFGGASAVAAMLLIAVIGISVAHHPPQPGTGAEPAWFSDDGRAALRGAARQCCTGTGTAASSGCECEHPAGWSADCAVGEPGDCGQGYSRDAAGAGCDSGEASRLCGGYDRLDTHRRCAEPEGLAAHPGCRS